MRAPPLTFEQNLAWLRERLAMFGNEAAPPEPRTFAVFCNCARPLDDDELDAGLTVVVMMRNGAVWVGEIMSANRATIRLRLWGSARIVLDRRAIKSARLVDTPVTWAERIAIATRQRGGTQSSGVQR